MTEQYTPTTEEVLGMLGSHLYEYGAGCDMNLPGNSPDEIVDRWLAKRDAEVAAKAWDEGQAAEELAWEHAFNGHPVPEGEACDVCKVVNPYRKAVAS